MNTIKNTKNTIVAAFLVALFAVVAIPNISFASHFIVYTNSVTSISGNFAILNGYVDSADHYSYLVSNNNDRITETVAWFEWGTSTIFDNRTPKTRQMTENNISVGISGLTQGTTYFVRAVAENSQGLRINGSTISFTTAGVKPRADEGATTNTNVSVVKPRADEGATTNPNTSVVINTAPVKKVAVTPTKAEGTVSKAAPTKVVTNTQNRNVAAVAGAGGGILPETLIGWVALLIALLIVALLVHMILESTNKRKRVEEEEDLEEEIDEENKNKT